jgi:transposase, IS30 family
MSSPLTEGWTSEQIAGRLKRGIERGLRALCAETIYAWISCAGQKLAKLWRLLVRKHVPRGRRAARNSRDQIPDKTHILERSAAANRRAEAGHWEADLLFCQRVRPVLVHERKTKLTLMTGLAGKSAGETVAALMTMLRRLSCSVELNSRRKDPRIHTARDEHRTDKGASKGAHGET